MPNYIAHILTINESEDKVKKFLEAVNGSGRAFDFNKIIPMPEELEIESGSIGELGMNFLLGDKSALDKYNDKGKEKAIRLGAKYLVNLALYGAKDWYDWRRCHWGTKWNAFDIEVEGNQIRFSTAWNAPDPIFCKIAQMFPDYCIEVVYADEDCGCNTGRYTIENGDCSHYSPGNNSEEAWSLYFETHPGMEDEMHQDENGNWVWNEE